jgi:predicted peptidase
MSVFSSVSCLVPLLLILAHASTAADEPFTSLTFTGPDGTTLAYRLLSPETQEPGKRYPLVVFLHGAGERGSDNLKQLKHGAGTFAKGENRKSFPCFVLAPQCPDGKRWCEVDWGDPKPHQTPAKPSVPMGLLLALLDQFRQRPSVDQARLYVTGLSMGGFGTWDLLTRRPGLFAAGAPICGGGDVTAAPALAKLPLWVFHGADDTVVKTVRSRLMVDALKGAGSTLVKYSEYPGVGHDAWSPAFKEAEFLPWLFAQRRGN